MENIGWSNNLRQLLNQRKLSQKELREQTNIPRSTLDAYLAGKRKINLLDFIAIADALSMTLDGLVDKLGLQRPKGTTLSPILSLNSAINNLVTIP